MVARMDCSLRVFVLVSVLLCRYGSSGRSVSGTSKLTVTLDERLEIHWCGSSVTTV